MANINVFTETIMPLTNVPPVNGNSMPQPDIHPSLFQDVNSNTNNLTNIKTLDAITTERLNIFRSKNTGQKIDIANLVSPGHYKLTADDGDTELSNSNTRFLFKNLYGETLLTFLFFSNDNIQNIQNLLKMMVYKHMNKIIDNQSTRDLMIIMRSIFLEYSQHPPLIEENMPQDVKNKLLVQYTAEISRLNTLVLDELVPLTCSQLQQYIDYIKDASSPLHFMELPKSDSVTGQKQYRSVTNLLTGNL